MVFHRADGLLHRIERATAAREHGETGKHRGADALPEFLTPLPGIGAGAAVHNDARHARALRGARRRPWRHADPRVTILNRHPETITSPLDPGARRGDHTLPSLPAAGRSP